MSYGRSPGSRPGNGYRRAAAPRSTDTWKRSLAPHEQIDLEVSLLEVKLKSAEGSDAETIKTQIAALKRLGGKMGTRGKFTAAVEKFVDGVTKGVADLAALDAQMEAGAILPKYHEAQRLAILRGIRVADGEAGDLFAAYQRETLAEARRLRALADAERDPAQRVADELEMARLSSSTLDGDVFAEQARDVLAAGQPRRAAFLLDVAKQKGARMTDALRADVEAALDEAVPHRASAREIEAEVQDRTVEFVQIRTKALAGSLGIAPDGTLGGGSSEERTSASVASKMAAYAAGERTFKVGTGEGGTASQ